ncbi:hypothetical protein ISS86_02370 [Candidatus Microgenomates bacterium]|nr:hypothetical protein [Candidatus Microgenomates bacterium]
MKNIIIPNPKKLEKLKKTIAKNGSEKLHILSDFDRTLTTAFVDKKAVPSLISILRDYNYLTPEYSKKTQALYKKYRPIETNPKIPNTKKKKAMHQWWTTHFNLLIKTGLYKKDVENVIKSGKVKLRPGALKLIDFLKSQNIPLVIMSSSGLGFEAISWYLKNKKRLYDNIYIISNIFEWNKKGKLVGVKKPIIHSMNKDETSVKKLPVYKVIKNRKNALLLGDSLQDVGMIKGFDYDNLIKIGFLNENIKENLPHYKKAYDVVLTNDTSMNFINNLLKQLLVQ